MQDLIKDAISRKDRRSEQKIAPLAEAELEYSLPTMQATQDRSR